MTSKLKFLGLAIVAIAAMSMAAASAAYATNGEIHISAGPNADITGEQEGTGDKFVLTKSGSTAECTQANFEGTVPSATAGITRAILVALTPRYTGCKVEKPINLGNATFDMNGCKFTLTGGGSQALTNQVDITDCTSGKKIQITTQVGCTIDVPEQGTFSGLSHITLTNIAGSPETVTSHATVTGITYEFTGIFCPEATGVAHNDGVYTGTEVFKGFKDTGETKQVTHNGHQYNEIICGAQVSIFAT